jgi:hypothetical protein
LPISTSPKSVLASSLGLSALLAIGCGAPPQEAGETIVFDACAPTLLRLSPEASPADHEAVTAALALWQTAGGPPLGVASAAEPLFEQVLPIGFQPAAPLFYGLYRPARGDILINSQLARPEARAITIAHEIGHAFGLPHVSGHRSLMNPGNLQVPPSGEEARLIFQRSGTCPR